MSTALIRRPRPLMSATPSAMLRTRLAVGVIAAAALAACDSDDDGSGAGAAVPLTLRGVAASGAALAGATIVAHCASGSGSATAGTDGGFVLPVEGGALPCVLQASSGDTTLHSVVVNGDNAGAQVNITPLTELLVAQITGSDPAALFASAASGGTVLGSVLTGAAVSAAQAAVLATLSAAGVDTSSVGDIVAGTLAAGGGEGYDGVLDALAAQLAAGGSTLAELATTVAAGANAGTGSSTSESGGNSLLPAELLLRPKAPGCDALRSSRYHVMIAKAAATSKPNVATMTVDATNAGGPLLVFDDATVKLVAVAGDACHYTVAANPDGFSADLLVAPSGVIVARAVNTWTDGEAAPDTNPRMLVAVPAQTIALADLVGDWNWHGWSWDSARAGARIDAAVLSVDAGGSAAARCTDFTQSDATCVAVPGMSYAFGANADGGYDLKGYNSGLLRWTTRVFAFRAGNGKLMLVGIDVDGSVGAAARVATLTLPALGDARSWWNLTLNSSLVAIDALAGNAMQVTQVDATSFTRTVTALSTGVSHAQTLTVNSPRTGLQYRAAGTTAASDGSTVTVRRMYALPLGTGLTAYYLPANNDAGSNARFGFSVRKPF